MNIFVIHQFQGALPIFASLDAAIASIKNTYSRFPGLKVEVESNMQNWDVTVECDFGIIAEYIIRPNFVLNRPDHL
jgi:hypothetical protein